MSSYFRVFSVLLCIGVLLARPIPFLAQDDLKTSVINLIDAIYNNGDVTLVNDVFADDYIRHPAESNRDDFIVSVLAFRSAMPDLMSEIDLILAQGDTVAVRLRASGTFQNDYIAGPDSLVEANGQPVSFVMHSIFRFNDNGQIAEEWTTFDSLNFSLQMSQQPNLSASDTTFTLYPDVVDVGMSDQNRGVVEQFFAGLNQGNWEFIGQNVKPDFIGHNPFGQLNHDQLIADLQRLRGALPDLAISTELLVTEGNWTVILYQLNGTFASNYVLPGGEVIPPTGGVVDLTVITFFRFEQTGFIAEYFELYDSFTFMVQLGLLSPTGA